MCSFCPLSMAKHVACLQRISFCWCSFARVVGWCGFVRVRFSWCGFARVVGCLGCCAFLGRACARQVFQGELHACLDTLALHFLKSFLSFFYLFHFFACVVYLCPVGFSTASRSWPLYGGRRRPPDCRSRALHLMVHGDGCRHGTRIWAKQG